MRTPCNVPRGGRGGYTLKRVFFLLLVFLFAGTGWLEAVENRDSEAYPALETTVATEPAGIDRQVKERSEEHPEQVRMDEIVVTATRDPLSARELPVRTEVISRKEIEKSHAKDLADLLLQELPGHFQSYPGGLTSVQIRGFSSDTHGTDIKGRVAVLIDGHRAGTGNIAVIPLENVERVEIVRGPGSVVYGSAAMGGVVNIITRKGRGNPSAGGGVEYGSWDQLKATARLSSGFWNDRAGISMTARHARSGDYDSGEGAKVQNTGYQDEAYSLSFHAAPFSNHQFFATGHYYRAWDVGNPGPTYAPDFDDYKDVLRRYGSFAYDGGLPDADVSWHVSFYDVFDRSAWNDPGKVWGYLNSTTETQTRGVRSQISLPAWNLGRLLLGFDYDNIGVSNFTKPPGQAGNPNSSYDNYAVFGEEKIDWNRFSFLLGVRYDYFRESLEPTEGLTVHSKEETFDHLSWRAGVKYSILDRLHARAAVGTGFRAPAADELAGRYEQSWAKTVGNPNLKPETATTYETGIDGEFGRLNAGLGFFYTDYTDRISGGFPTCIDGDCSWTTYKNLQGAVLSGIEVYLRHPVPVTICDRVIRFIPFAELLYYTQREIQDRKYVQSLGTDILPYVSRTNVTGGLQIDFDRKADLQFTAVYHGRQEVQDWDWMSPDYGKAVGKGGFGLYFARLNYRPCRRLNVFFAVDNLADRSYSYVDGYPMPGRTFRIGLEGRY